MRDENSGSFRPKAFKPVRGRGHGSGFWGNALRFLRFAGKQVIHKALLLHYAAQSSRTPKWAKTAIYGALAYFALPLDLVPDLLPAIGYTDDLWVLAAAVATVSFYIDDTVRSQAERRLQSWFGPEIIKPLAD